MDDCLEFILLKNKFQSFCFGKVSLYELELLVGFQLFESPLLYSRVVGIVEIINTDDTVPLLQQLGGNPICNKSGCSCN